MSRQIRARANATVERQMAVTYDRNHIMPNDYRFNKSYPNLRPLRMGCFEQGQTTIRIWPMLDPTNPTGNLLRGRISDADTAGLSGLSMESVKEVNMAGLRDPRNPSLADATTITYIVAPADAHEIFGIPIEEEPYMLMQRVAWRAKQQADQASPRGGWAMRWSSYVTNLPNQRYPTQMVPKVRSRYHVVCSIFENGPDMTLVSERQRRSATETVTLPRGNMPYGWAENDPLFLLEVGVSAVNNLFKLLTLPQPGVTGATRVANPSDLFVAGEPAGYFDAATGTIRGGKFVTFYNPEVTPRPLNVDPYMTSFDLPRGQQREMGVSYHAAISDVYNTPGGPAGPDVPAAQTRMIFARHGYFFADPNDPEDDCHLLELLPIEQRCELIAKAFSADPAFLEFCWRTHPHYLAYDSVQAILAARVAVAAAEAASHQQMYQQPPQQMYQQPQMYQQQPPQMYQQPPQQMYQQPQPHGFAPVPPAAPVSPALAIAADFTAPPPPQQQFAPPPPVPQQPPQFAPPPPVTQQPQFAPPPPVPQQQFAPPPPVPQQPPQFAPSPAVPPAASFVPPPPSAGAYAPPLQQHTPPWQADESEVAGDDDFDDIPGMTESLDKLQTLLHPSPRTSPPPPPLG